MAFCIPVISSLAKFYVSVFTFFLKFFIPLEGITLTLAALVISSGLIFLFGKMLGRLGGILLMVIGIIGAFFSAGTTLIITAIGTVLFFYGRATNLIVLLNILFFGLAILCSI